MTVFPANPPNPSLENDVHPKEVSDSFGFMEFPILLVLAMKSFTELSVAVEMLLHTDTREDHDLEYVLVSNYVCAKVEPLLFLSFFKPKSSIS